MRYALMAVLALGVVGGYGSAMARAAHSARGGGVTAGPAGMAAGGTTHAGEASHASRSPR